MAVRSISVPALICFLILGLASLLNAIVCDNDDDYAKIISERQKVVTYFTGFTRITYEDNVIFFKDLPFKLPYYDMLFVVAETEHLQLPKTLWKYGIPFESLPVVTFMRNGTVVDRCSGLVDGEIVQKVAKLAFEDLGSYDE